MNNYMLPTNDEFIEEIARAISRDRLFREAADLLQSATGHRLDESPNIDKEFGREFDRLWSSKDEIGELNRESYRADARVAINRINLLLLTNTQS